MRALLITASLCLTGTAVVAQPASQTVVGLDTCFKLVRVAEVNCSSPATEAVLRPACLQNARKVQLECLQLAGPQASASVDRPQTAAAAVPSDRPTGAVSPVIAAGTSPAGNPVAAAPADQKESTSARTLAAAPSDKSVAAPPPGLAAPSTSVSSGAQGSEWTVSETTSPVDYSALVTATILARPDTKNSPMALVVRCGGRRTELGLRMEGSSPALRGGEIVVAHQINDQPMVKLRWTASAEGKTASYRDDAVTLLQSFSDGGQLKVVVADGSGRTSEATFQLAGWSAIRDKIATACMWTSTAAKSPQRR